MIGIDKEGLPDEEPERSEGNRPQSENCDWRQANQRSGRTNTKITANFYFAK